MALGAHSCSGLPTPSLTDILTKEMLQSTYAFISTCTTVTKSCGRICKIKKKKKESTCSISIVSYLRTAVERRYVNPSPSASGVLAGRRGAGCLLAGSPSQVERRRGWSGGRPVTLSACVGLRAVSDQQPSPFFSPSLRSFKIPPNLCGENASDSRSQGHFSKLICTPEHQARSVLGDFPVGCLLEGIRGCL